MVGYLGEVLDIQYLNKTKGCDDQLIAIATNIDQVTMFNESTGHCSLLAGHTGVVLSLCSTSDGQLLLTASKVEHFPFVISRLFGCFQDNTVRVWKWAETEFFCCAVGSGHTLSVGAVGCSRY